MASFKHLQTTAAWLALACLMPPTAHAQITLPPDISPEAVQLMNEGVALSNSQKYAAAAEKFGAVVKEQPDFVEAQSMYGFCLLRSGKLAEADAALSKAYALNPNRPMTLLNLATAKQREGQLPQAIDMLEQFLKADPKGEYSHQAKAMLQSLNREMNERGSRQSSAGQADYFSEATAPGVARWAGDVNVYIKPADAVKGYTPEFRKILQDAISQWVDALGGAISVKYVDAPPAIGLTCSFTDDPSQLKNSMEGGEATASVNGAGIIQIAQLKILTTNAATGADEDPSVIKSTCLHELGHVLGLRGHSSDNHDIMFGFRATPPNTMLSDRDKATIRKLYSAGVARSIK